jgi:hypothetical protein
VEEVCDLEQTLRAHRALHGTRYGEFAQKWPQERVRCGA